MKCKRCGKESDELRTLKLDYFWQIEGMDTFTYYIEGDPKASYIINTFDCQDVTQIRLDVGEITTDENGTTTTHLRDVTKKVDPKFLVEHGGYQIRTCKNCRGEFLRMFEGWLGR